MTERDVEKRLRIFANALVPGNFRHTDYLTPLTLDLKTLADGIVAAPILSGHDVIHYGDGKSGFVIGAGEFAAGKQRDPHGREISGADLVVLDRKSTRLNSSHT